MITNVWVDGSWTIREESSDVCSGLGGLWGSIYSTQDSIFSCGPTAVSALACVDEGEGETVCITNAANRTAMRFSSPTVAGEDVGPRSGASIPLYVELADGVTCTAIDRDHDQHWGGKFSWYPCSDGSELLTDQDIAGTFDSGSSPWTVQRSVGKAAPVEAPVTTVAYAGR